ncbi:glycosyltransferase family 29 protein [Ensifer soli]|uniref:glycosyltransferase family 29 protein n=1 Tax=Ciceribacter sp. sgz301302 TaxID=3342379 RepID=UPI0035BB26FD
MQPEKIFPPDVAMADLFGPFDSIAVVGNSPRLVEKRQGGEIDAHDVVVRINDGRTAPHEASTGSRTTVRFVGALLKDRYRGFFSGLREEARLVTSAENVQSLADFGWSGRLEVIEQLGWTIRSSFTRLASVIEIGELPDKNPRTGIIVLSLLVDAMRAGRKVSVYGMETEPRKTGAEHFYADGRDFGAVLKGYGKYHCPMTVEFSMLKQLQDRALVTVN